MKTEKERLEHIIKKRGACTFIGCKSCPIYATCHGMSISKENPGNLEAAIKVFITKYGTKEDVVEILI